MRRRLAVLLLLGAVGCGKRPEVAPQTPNQTLAQFMDAVKAKDLARMGTLFGSDQGPMANRMKPEDLNKRLTVVQIYLAHDGYRIVDGPQPKSGSTTVIVYHLELQRRTCVIAAPIDLMKGKDGGWFVNDIHLESLPNPARSCGAGSGT